MAKIVAYILLCASYWLITTQVFFVTADRGKENAKLDWVFVRDNELKQDLPIA